MKIVTFQTFLSFSPYSSHLWKYCNAENIKCFQALNILTSNILYLLRKPEKLFKDQEDNHIFFN